MDGGILLRNRMTFRATLACAFAVLAPPALADPPAPSAFPDLPPPPAIEGLIGMPQVYAKGRRVHLTLVRREAKRRGLPPDVADAVAQVESAYDPGAVGDVGEIGLMQVRPETAHLLGHRGSVEALFEPETNVRYGITYLSRAWEVAGGDLCRALMKYRAGHGEERMTTRSVEYCRRAINHLATIGSPLANAPLPVADAAEDGTSRASRTKGKRLAIVPPRGASRMAREMRSRQIWAALEADTEAMPLVTVPPRGASRVARETRSREIWAAHEARLRAIRERLLPGRPLISTGI
jgi:Transglycosylase SLT domain